MEALTGQNASSDTVPVLELQAQIPKPAGDSYEIDDDVENFERVEDGEAFATVDGREIVASDPFYPVLLSANGYDRQFGYTAELIDRLDHPVAEPLVAGGDR